jgi:uncharacterized membrane protein
LLGLGPAASNALWRVKRALRTTSVRAGLFAGLAASTAGAAYFIKAYIPEGYDDLIGASAVGSLLTVLASSLLSVTTFTLGAMVSSYNSAAAATPRATPLIIGDPTSQNVLSVFVGAFVFSIVGLVLLQTGVYGGSGRVVLFAATILVLGIVVAALLRWIHRVSHLGLLSDSIDLVEETALAALNKRIARPNFGARPPAAAIGVAMEIYPDEVGYVRHVDMAKLQELAEAHDFVVHLRVAPGSFVAPSIPLAAIVGPAPKDAPLKLAKAFEIGVRRNFDEDVRFGFLVLSEIASKALSPAINDPGTALDILVRASRLLEAWARRPGTDEPPAYDRIHAPEIATDDLFDDAFDAIERDGAGLVEVALRVQLALTILASSHDPDTAAAARRHSRRALARARTALSHADDFARVAAAAIAHDGESA